MKQNVMFEVENRIKEIIKEELQQQKEEGLRKSFKDA